MRILPLLFLCCSILSGQFIGRNTVYRKVFEDLTAVPATSTPLPSIGQSSHFVIVHAKDQSPNVCVSPAGNINVDLEVSFEGTTWFQGVMIETEFVQTDENANIYSYTINGGVFPFLRMQVDSFDNVNCQLDVFYAGSVSPSNTMQARLGVVGSLTPEHNQIITPISVDNNFRPMAVSVYGFDGTENTTILLDCANSVAVSVGAAATTEIVGLAAGQSIYVCSFSLTMPAAGTIQFVQGTGANCAVGQTSITGAYDVPLAGFIRDGGTIGKIWEGNDSEALCITTTGVGATAKGLVTYAQY